MSAENENHQENSAETAQPWPAIRGVEDFASSYGEGADPHEYPGERPEGSYLTDGETVLPMRAEMGNGHLKVTAHTAEGDRDLDEMLQEQGLTGLGERIPVVAYGANASPAALKDKFTIGGRPDLAVVPTLSATLKGSDVVWHNVPGQKGNFFAELQTDETTANTEVQVGINFLTREQLLYLHRSEGSYDFGRAGQVELEDGTALPAIMYAGQGEALKLDGQTVAVAGIERRGSDRQELTSKDALNQVLAIDGVAEAAIAEAPELEGNLNADTYAAAANARKLDGKKALQAAVSGVLAQGDFSETVSNEAAVEELYSWSNPSLVPTLDQLMQETEEAPASVQGQTEVFPITLPEQDLALAGLSEAGAKKRNFAIKQVRKHWHDRRERDMQALHAQYGLNDTK